METKDLKKRFKDLTVVKLTMDTVYSRRDIEEKVRKQFGNTVLRYEHNGKKVNIASSATYGKFIGQLKQGVKVVMTGAEIEMKPEYAKRLGKSEQNLHLCAASSSFGWKVLAVHILVKC